jgi:hypothetical protein
VDLGVTVAISSQMSTSRSFTGCETLVQLWACGQTVGGVNMPNARRRIAVGGNVVSDLRVEATVVQERGQSFAQMRLPYLLALPRGCGGG